MSIGCTRVFAVMVTLLGVSAFGPSKLSATTPRPTVPARDPVMKAAALSESTGKERWLTRTPFVEPVTARVTAVSHDLVYIAGWTSCGGPNMRGEVLWAHDFEAGSTAFVRDGIVLVTTETSVVGYRAEDGRELWQWPRLALVRPKSTGNGVVLAVEGGKYCPS